MISKRGGFIIQHYDELRDLEAERHRMVCRDVEIEHRRRVEQWSRHHPCCAAGYSCSEILGEANVGFFLCENLPPKYRLVLSDERLGAKLRVTENRHTHKLKDLKIL